MLICNWFKRYLIDGTCTNLFRLWEWWLEGPGLLKPSYSSSLTGEISRPSYWGILFDAVLASVAGWLLIGMLTPVMPVRGLVACLDWPREYSPPWLTCCPEGVDMRRRCTSLFKECVAEEVLGLEDSAKVLTLSLCDCLEWSVAALDARLFFKGGRTKFLPM